MKISLRVLLLIVTAVCLYLGAYVQLSDPVIIVEEGHHGIVIKGYVQPSYKFENPLVEKLFLPAYYVDYMLRKEYWSDYHDEFDWESPVPWQSLTKDGGSSIRD